MTTKEIEVVVALVREAVGLGLVQPREGRFCGANSRLWHLWEVTEGYSQVLFSMGGE